MSPHLIRRVTILGTGLIGSFAMALKKSLPHPCFRMGPSGNHSQRVRHAFDETFSGNLARLAKSDLIYIALPIGVTLDSS
jgi:prephenate dehydrogenase